MILKKESENIVEKMERLKVEKFLMPYGPKANK